MGPLFLTGATGFVGRRLLERLPPAQHSEVRCLTRHPAQLPATRGDGIRLESVVGDLTSPDRWAERLAGVETVLHLGALTGKARGESFEAVNHVATRGLLARARAAGVTRFIFVSSVAVGFPDQRHYPYAHSKARAEQAVLASGLDTLIVRPTMVLGPGSAVLTGLSRLATAPAGIVFGAGKLPVQPIHVDDLADLLIAALALQPLGGRTVDAGGAEVLELNELLRQIRVRATGRPGPMLHLPLAPIRAALAAIEPLAFSLLPFTAGQLASFANAGTARPDPLVTRLHRPILDLAAMLSTARPDA
ncbi:MAG: NAD(P)H-binding protein [Gemmatimonadota bacterium]